MTLGKLKAGSKAIIIAVRSNCTVLGSKLVARGIVPGAEVAILQGGDPLAFSLEDSQWALTRAEADLIEVAIL